MPHLRTFAVAAALIVPMAISSSSFAQGRGPGPCTPGGNYAVGAAGPAMSGGQLMAGVGQCGQLSSWSRNYGYRQPAYSDDYGYRGPSWAPGFAWDDE